MLEAKIRALSSGSTVSIDPETFIALTKVCVRGKIPVTGPWSSRR